MGGEALIAHAEAMARRAARRDHGGRRVTLEAVYCLGNCALSPAVMLDGRAPRARRPRRGSSDWSSQAEALGVTRVFVPADAAALSVGADEVARAIQAPQRRRTASTSPVVRNGSRGLFWLEPLVEVETRAGRVAYGP